MKVNLCYAIDGFNNLDYNLDDLDLQKYLDWCDKYEFEYTNTEAFEEYIQNYIDFTEDLDIKTSFIVSREGITEAINRCKALKKYPSKYKIIAQIDCITGHLRYGHYEGELTEEQYQEYLSLDNDKDRNDFIRDVCNLVVDSYSVDFIDPPTNIEIKKLNGN